MKKSVSLFLCFFLFFVCTVTGQQPGVYTNPVIPGDMADPTVVRIGDVYYASGTSSEWAPFYPFFVSKDLVNWTQQGHLFQQQPEWTSSSFWAPELFYYRNQLYAYYTARNKKGISYIGVATSEKPGLPFTDHGLIVELGTEAIDAFVLEDKGELYISWKAYGLDNRPIELLACKLSEDGLHLSGEPFSLMKDEERIGMEGQYWFKKGDYYYMLYSVRGCCGPQSDYQVYAARSKELQGPYEKYPGNPVLSGDGKDVLSCGHGTVTTTPDGRMYYLFHAYLKGDRFFAGRQIMLQEVSLGDDDWLHFTTGPKTSLAQKTPYPGTVQEPVADFEDFFKSSVLSDKWTWNYPYSTLKTDIRNGKLSLSGIPNPDNKFGTALCVRPTTSHYAYETRVMNKNGSFKGLTMYGDAGNLIAFGCINNRLMVREIKGGKETILTNIPLSVSSPFLKIEVNNATGCSFFWSADGKDWKRLPMSTVDLDVSYLVRWDRVARPGLIHIGTEKSPAQFEYFKIVPATEPNQ